MIKKQINYLNIQPSQFYISLNKIAKIKKWFNPEDLSNFEPVPIKEIDGNIIFTDGHTRAFVAFSAGLKKIPITFEKEELDWDMYKLCIEACIQKGIYTIRDLETELLDEIDYDLKWHKWCDTMQKSVLKKRKK